MNLTRPIRARRARRRAVRVTLFALACLLAVAGSTFKPAAQAGAVAAPTQEVTKGRVAKRRTPQTDAQQQTAAPGKGAKFAAADTAEAAITPASTSCPNKTPISSNTTVNGTLSNTDCPLGDGTFFDEWTFTANAGQTVSVSMNSDTFDTYLFLLKPSESAPTQSSLQNDDGGTGGPGGNRLNSRIPANSGTITLPETGTYSILANAISNLNLNIPTTGPYTLTLTFGPGGGTICPPNPTAISNGQTLNGSLDANDCQLASDNSFYEAYSFTASANQQVSITMTKTNAGDTLNPFVELIPPGGTIANEDFIATDDNSAGNPNAHIPSNTTNGFAVLPATGTYIILANSAQAGETGAYSITLNIAATNCPSTAINIGQTVNGALAASDCRLPADGSFLDQYTFNGTQGQQVAITMSPAAPAGVDPFLFLLSSQGADLVDDDNSGGGTVARIPGATGFFMLPATGTYTIYANSAQANQTGGYTLSITTPASCTYTLAQTSANIPSAGGTFSVGFTTQAGCAAPTATSNDSWLTNVSATVNASGQGTVNYTAAADTTGAGRTGSLTIAGQTFTVTQASNCSFAISPTLRPFRADGGTNGRLTVVANSTACGWTAASDADWITITSPAGGNGTGTGRVRYNVAPNNGTQTRTGHILINASTTSPLTYTVTQTAVGTTPMVQFSAAAYTFAESSVAANNTNAATITVTRVGDAAGAITVEYSTVDNPAAVPCDPNARDGNGNPFPRGTAFARCDYATTLDTLTLAPGEVSKDFLVPLINDVHNEGGNETFQVQIANAEGATLGTQTTATVTITDDDSATSTTNPINQTPFFVRLNYLDFLSREPDPSGFSAWTGVLNRCADPFNTDPNSPNAGCDRIIVSQSFFGSPEFQLKGTFVFLFHKAAFGASNNPIYFPEYADFAADLRRVTGATSEEVFAKRLDFTEDFVTRPAFVARYSTAVMPDNTLYVDTLLSNIATTLPSATRSALISDLNAGIRTRAEVLRAIVESPEANQRQLNFAFVAVQYYGYLRRTPDASGYQAWLNALLRGENSRTMVNGFMNSVEYRLRFGPNVLQ